MTVMGDASMDGLSDAGSIPARSTDKNAVIWDLTNKVPDYGIFH